METNFAVGLERYGDQVAVLDEHGRSCTYRELASKADQMARDFGPRHTLVLIRCTPSLQTLTAYLACLRRQRVALLVDAGLDASFLQGLIAAYTPEIIVEPQQGITRTGWPAKPVRADLALLMSTSGSTGTPQMVMLSLNNLQANAGAICRFLPITTAHRAITTLPLHYSYGLSVVNTHLLSGARISLNTAGIVSRQFWNRFRDEGITSLAGVPYFYEMLWKIGFARMTLPSLRYFTQAGGRLAPDLVTQLGTLAIRWGLPFFVMYGQTEATARIAYLPPAKLLKNAGSIGIAIPDGELALRDTATGTQTHTPDVEGELMYRGPNVMLGYAAHRKDLYGDRRLNELATGDLARRDHKGFYTITGRLRRFIKLFGQRINLDALEQRLQEEGCHVLCGGRDQELVIGCLDNTASETVTTWIQQRLGIHPSVVQVRRLPARPLTASGKTDYSVLLEDA